MEIKVDKKFLKQQEVDIPILLNQIATGKAILFTGAGFSKGALNIDNEEPPFASDLSAQICRLGEFGEDKDLRYAADYYIYNCEKDRLVELLKRNYVIKSVSDVHNHICSIQWRRFYTTNYDKCIEIASGNSGRLIECIDIDYPTVEYYKREGLCIHLNGSIDSLTIDTLNNSFKLSTSSYISSDTFLNSDWYYYFRKDLERSSAIVFAGYSMYDVEIQKILHENDFLKNKTYFVTRKNPSPKSVFTLSKFGKLLPIGIERFSEIIHENYNIFEVAENDYNLQALYPYEITNDCTEIRDSDVETLLMYGDIDDEHIDNGVCGNQRFTYLIIRDKIEQILDFTLNNKNTIIYGDLGNGKTILLKELKPYLTVNSIEVYEIIDWEGDYIGDLDFLSNSNKKIVVLIDGYERYIDLITHYSKSLPDNINIIASARTAEHERLRSELNDIGFEYNEIDVDILSDNEASAFVKIIDNIGMWGDKAGFSHDRKIQLLKKNNVLQLSLSLLYLLNAPQIKQRISNLLADLIIDQECRDTIFSIALIETLDLKATFSLISEVAMNNYIYSSHLKRNESFNHLFRTSGNRVLPKSRLYCLALIRNHLSTSYVTNQLQKIARLFNRYRRKDFEQDRIFKAMLRFSTVERLIPDANKKSNLKRYYEDLKVSVPWLINDPHYWLQYGMANITFQEYNRAQQFIDQAYALAATRENYHTKNIDTQQARLYNILAIRESDNAIIYKYFNKAHVILTNLDNDAYKFRQVQKYRDIFDACYVKLSRKNKQKFIGACDWMLNQIMDAESSGVIFSGQASVNKAKNNLLYIAKKIA